MMPYKYTKRGYIMNEIKTTQIKTPLRVPRLNDIMPSLMMILAARASALGVFPFGAAFFAASFDKSVAYVGIIPLMEEECTRS